MQLPTDVIEMLEKAKEQGWDLSLTTITALLDELDSPQNKIPAIHVTGTNGKGSVCTFIASIMKQAGYRVGKYTSPAIETEFERYCINDVEITEDDYYSILVQLIEPCEKIEKMGLRYPSLFEIETALAYCYFFQQACDIMVIEVGMGGLLDATNVLQHPLACVFSNIDIEHTTWLGKTLTEIAQNKAGIIKAGASVISCQQHPEVISVLKEISITKGCEFLVANDVDSSYKLGLLGDKQYSNAGIAKETVLALNKCGFSITSEAIESGLANAYIKYRFELIHDNPKIILDGAHNIAATKVLVSNIKKYLPQKRINLIVSVLKDKAFDEMFSLVLPLAANVVVVESTSERALDIETLYFSAKKYNSNCYKALDFYDAVSHALDDNPQAVITFGTFTYLYQIKKEFLEYLKSD